mgnify:CR=1 FL=1
MAKFTRHFEKMNCCRCRFRGLWHYYAFPEFLLTLFVSRETTIPLTFIKKCIGFNLKKDDYCLSRAFLHKFANGFSRDDLWKLCCFIREKALDRGIIFLGWYYFISKCIAIKLKKGCHQRPLFFRGFLH